MSRGNTPKTGNSATQSNDSQRVLMWATSCGVTVLAFSLLLWSRFIIATNHPRSAYAEPEAPHQLQNQPDQQHQQTDQQYAREDQP